MERRDRYRRPQYRRGGDYRNRGPRKKKQFIKKSRDVIILDVLSRGHPEDDKPSWTKTPLAQVLTFPDFVLYEVKINKELNLIPEVKKTYEEFQKENKLRDVLKKMNSYKVFLLLASPTESFVETLGWILCWVHD